VTADGAGSRLLRDLVDAGLLIPTGVQGVLGRSGTFESVLLGFDALLDRVTAPDGAEVVRFPPVMPREALETAGYMRSFPHLAGSVFSFGGSEVEALDLGALADRHEDWSELQSMTDVMLAPAACYSVYPWVARAGTLPRGGRLVDISGACFRHEPSEHPARMQSFRMHELVRVGQPAEVDEWRIAWIERCGEILASVGLETDVVPASDPFFGRVGVMLSTSQLEQNLKLERVVPIDGGEPTAIASVNYHQDHFGVDFGIRSADGELAHSACAAFGLERITLALYSIHGVDDREWPSEVRELLSLSAP
jgi:seryl-tRNA synthetase